MPWNSNNQPTFLNLQSMRNPIAQFAHFPFFFKCRMIVDCVPMIILKYLDRDLMSILVYVHLSTYRQKETLKTNHRLDDFFFKFLQDYMSKMHFQFLRLGNLRTFHYWNNWRHSSIKSLLVAFKTLCTQKKKKKKKKKKRKTFMHQPNWMFL